MSTLVVETVAPASGTLNIDGALQIGGGSLSETIADTVGAMVSSNTESGISVTYDDADNTLDFSLTADPTLTLSGDASGSATFTNLGNATLSVTIADDSHNHVISNIDNLQSSLDGKAALSGATFTGDVTAPNFNTTSDAAVKSGIMTIDSPLSTISNLRGVNFDWKNNGQKSMGVVAQEVEKVLPYLVSTDANGLKSVNYQAMVGLLIESVKDLQAQVAKLSK
jgi:hypothetical protein